MIPRRAVVCLGFSQLVCWGISYYLIGVFGELIVADLGWTLTAVYGGFTAALVVMGLTSPLIGRLMEPKGTVPLGKILPAERPRGQSL